MHEAHTVQRHFARRQFDDDRFRRIHVDCDFLTAREKVVARERIAMRNLIGRVRTGNEFHRAVRSVTRRECNPRGDDVRLARATFGVDFSATLQRLRRDARQAGTQARDGALSHSGDTGSALHSGWAETRCR